MSIQGRTFALMPSWFSLLQYMCKVLLHVYIQRNYYAMSLEGVTYVPVGGYVRMCPLRLPTSARTKWCRDTAFSWTAVSYLSHSLLPVLCKVALKRNRHRNHNRDNAVNVVNSVPTVRCMYVVCMYVPMYVLKPSLQAIAIDPYFWYIQPLVLPNPDVLCLGCRSRRTCYLRNA